MKDIGWQITNAKYFQILNNQTGKHEMKNAKKKTNYVKNERHLLVDNER